VLHKLFYLIYDIYGLRNLHIPRIRICGYVETRLWQDYAKTAIIDKVGSYVLTSFYFQNGKRKLLD
jgi:hypothetical protein